MSELSGKVLGSSGSWTSHQQGDHTSVVSATHVDLGAREGRRDWVTVLGGGEGTRGGDFIVHGGVRLVVVPRRVFASREVHRTCRRIARGVASTAQPEEQRESDDDHAHDASDDASYDRGDVGRFLRGRGAVTGVAITAIGTGGL